MKTPLRAIPYWPLLLGPILAWGIGFLLNAIVIAANKGQMPVLYAGHCPEPYDHIHTCMLAQSHLKFLADWIRESSFIVSPGDYLMTLCEYTFWPALYIWAALMIVRRTR